MIGSALIFAFVAATKIYAVQHHFVWAKWVPSGVAFAIGFLNTPPFSLALFIGGIVEFLYYRANGNSGSSKDIRLIIVASGFVLGEGIISIVSLVLKTLGVGPASCMGCGTGICAGCPG